MGEFCPKGCFLMLPNKFLDNLKIFKAFSQKAQVKAAVLTGKTV